MKFTSLLIFTKAMSLLKVFFTKFGCMNTLMRKTTPKLFFNKTNRQMREIQRNNEKGEKKNTLSINLCCWCASSRRRSWSPRINRILSGLILTITISDFIVLSINIFRRAAAFSSDATSSAARPIALMTELFKRLRNHKGNCCLNEDVATSDATS